MYPHLRRLRLLLALIVLCSGAVLLLAQKKTLPADEVALGRMLFFDPILSKNRSLSCAGCHIPNRAFSDT
ncbi:MAG: Di-hem cytochrome c peroxidase, partial [Bacteroidota bacterium]